MNIFSIKYEIPPGAFVHTIKILAIRFNIRVCVCLWYIEHTFIIKKRLFLIKFQIYNLQYNPCGEQLTSSKTKYIQQLQIENYSRLATNLEFNCTMQIPY